MATLTRDCHHCKTRNSAFTLKWADRWIRSDRFDQIAVAVCGGCALPICFRGRGSDTNLMQYGADIEAAHVVVGEIWPLKEEPSIPRHLPPEYVAKVFEAEKAHQAALPTAVAGLYRSLVDITTKRQLTEAGLDVKGVLMTRIDRLADNHVIPKAVAEWAHEVRSIGNEGLHEEMVVSPEDAAMTRNFAQTYLRYAFELPGDIVARKVPAQTP